MQQTSKAFAASIYHPWEEDLYEDFNCLATSLLAKCPSNYTKIIGHDLNASLGIQTTEDEGFLDSTIGLFGIDNRNEKGELALQFLQQENLRAMTQAFSNTKHMSLTPPNSMILLSP